jgi:hypothetical protein
VNQADIAHATHGCFQNPAIFDLRFAICDRDRPLF